MGNLNKEKREFFVYIFAFGFLVSIFVVVLEALTKM
jgi:uncharacterized membrane protein